MRLSTMNQSYFYVISLIIVIALYTYVNRDSAVLYILSAALSLYVLKCQSKAILIALVVVGLYISGMNLREGMSAKDKTKAAKASAATQSKQKAKVK
jgi:hypothetical protein